MTGKRQIAYVWNSLPLISLISEKGNTWKWKDCQCKSQLSLPGSASGELQGNREVLWKRNTRKTWKVSYHWEKNPSKEGFKIILRKWMWEVILQSNTAALCSSHHCLSTQYFSRLMGLSELRDTQNDPYSPMLQQSIMKKNVWGVRYSQTQNKRGSRRPVSQKKLLKT